MQGRNRGGAPINGKGASDLKKLNNVTLKHDVDTIQDGKMEKKGREQRTSRRHMYIVTN